MSHLASLDALITMLMGNLKEPFTVGEDKQRLLIVSLKVVECIKTVFNQLLLPSGIEFVVETFFNLIKCIDKANMHGYVTFRRIILVLGEKAIQIFGGAEEVVKLFVPSVTPLITLRTPKHVEPNIIVDMILADVLLQYGYISLSAIVSDESNVFSRMAEHLMTSSPVGFIGFKISFEREIIIKNQFEIITVLLSNVINAAEDFQAICKTGVTLMGVDDEKERMTDGWVLAGRVVIQGSEHAPVSNSVTGIVNAGLKILLIEDVRPQQLL